LGLTSAVAHDDVVVADQFGLDVVVVGSVVVLVANSVAVLATEYSNKITNIV